MAGDFCGKKKLSSAARARADLPSRRKDRAQAQRKCARPSKSSQQRGGGIRGNRKIWEKIEGGYSRGRKANSNTYNTTRLRGEGHERDPVIKNGGFGGATTAVGGTLKTSPGQGTFLRNQRKKNREEIFEWVKNLEKGLERILRVAACKRSAPRLKAGVGVGCKGASEKAGDVKPDLWSQTRFIGKKS